MLKPVIVSPTLLPLHGLPLHALLPLKRFLECPLTTPLPLTQFSARSTPFSALHTCSGPHLCWNVPEFFEPENWPPNIPDLNTVELSVWRALQQIVYCQKIRHLSSEECAARLLVRQSKHSERPTDKKTGRDD